MNLEKRFRIVIASSSKLFLEGICKILKSQDDIKIVGKTSNPDEIDEYLNETKPEFLLLDNRTSNLDVCKLLNSLKKKNPETKVILFGDQPEDEFNPPDIIYITKETNSAELIEIIKNSNEGIPAKDITRIKRTKCKITKREIGVLELIEKGLSNKEIANTLLIREKTVKAHLGSIFTKLGFQRRYQLILYRNQVKPKAKLKV